MFPATPHRTAENRRVEPTPRIELVITWVVEIGAANAYAVVSMIPLATVCAANPPTGLSWITRRPSVRMIRQPPEYVPRLIASAELITTQNGTYSVDKWPEVNNASAITPIVFCASWVPCPNAIAAAEA